jgi:hypothetical protein
VAPIGIARPSTASTAVVPMATTTAGLTARAWASSQPWHAWISSGLGFACSRRLPRGSHLKCLTAFVIHTSARETPATRSAASSTRPAGPTNGRPCRSSWSPGCSPTSMIAAREGPLPNTVCVARA